MVKNPGGSHTEEKKEEKIMRKEQVDERLNPCTLVKPGNVNSVENKDGWMKIKFMVDSGANGTVIPTEELPEVPIRDARDQCWDGATELLMEQKCHMRGESVSGHHQVRGWVDRGD